MNTFFKSVGSTILIAIVASTLIMVGCGSGGGGSDSVNSGGVPASQTGTAALLLRDAPAEEYDSIKLCVKTVTLEPGSEPIFEAENGCFEVDLLDLQNKPFLLNVKDVPARTYQQMRMTVDYIETEGGPCDNLPIKLPSNVIKINPQGGIPIRSGDKVVIDIDVKAKQSVNIHTAGKSGKCIFRPVILAEVRTVDKLPPNFICPRILSGTITAINKVNDEVTGFKLKLTHSKYNEVRVRVDQNTVIFDEDGSFSDPSSLNVGQSVKVRGEIQNDLSILSSVIAVGNLINLHGTALSSVDNGKFGMNLDPGQGVVGEIDVAVDFQTLILIDCNTEVGSEEIKAGTGIRAIGKISGGVLIAVALFLEEQNNYGTIDAMQPSGNGYNMEFIPAGAQDSVTIFLPDTADVKMEGDGSINNRVLLADLVNCTPRQARVVLNDLDDTVADLVEIRNEMTGGKIKQDGLDNGLETIKLVSGEVIQVQDYATILKDNEPVAFSKLKAGDNITVFGLSACDGDQNGIDFYGFVIIIEDNNI